MKFRTLLATLLLAQQLTARPWTEAASGRKIEADYVSADAERVTLAVKGGKTFTIERARLSAEDQAYVHQRGTPAPATAAAAPAQNNSKAAKIEDSFEDLQIKAADAIPVSGTAHPALGPVDDAVRAFMAEKGIGAVSFALSKGGKILHDRVFGWADAAMKTPLQPGVKMRVASMTKPVVAAAIKTLFKAGTLKPEDTVFKVLDLGQYDESKNCDPRWQKITVKHLLDHFGGWAVDFTSSPDILKLFHLKAEEQTPEHVMRYGLTLKLDTEPGASYAYSNYGYILLVRIIEKVSGQTFMDYLHATAAAKAGATSFSSSSSDARDRQPGETWYCYAPEYPRKTVPLPFRTEARDGAGILACTAADYCRFLESYTVLGNPRIPGGKYKGDIAGSHPGVTAISAHRDDINYTIICNRRAVSKPTWNEELRTAVDAALSKAMNDLK